MTKQTKAKQKVDWQIGDRVEVTYNKSKWYHNCGCIQKVGKKIDS